MSVIFGDFMKNSLPDLVREATSRVMLAEGLDVAAKDVLVSATRKEFEGDLTVVIFPFVKVLGKNPADLGKWLGDQLTSELKEIGSYNVVQGFLNLSLNHGAWVELLDHIESQPTYGNSQQEDDEKVLVEFCSPNTNKPLHLGHIRNILLGWSCSKILEATGKSVVKIQIINDRGIAICKSMLAWKKYGEGENPDSAKMKGDYLVGKYYVMFSQKLAEEYDMWQGGDVARKIYAEKGKEAGEESFFKSFANSYFNKYSSLGKEAREMLIQWEQDDQEVKDLWSMMNGWVYDGFEETYRDLGVEFDQLYYESNTWVLGREQVLQGLESGLFFSKEDGSIWVDLTKEKMDEKILLRADGTSVYLTQDIGTAMHRYRDHRADSMVFVVGDEQNYHFKVLFEVLRKLGEPYADSLYHLSYGMVDLPTGKMKSREGTVVDADDLVTKVIEEAATVSRDKGDISSLTEKEQAEAFRIIGLGALKFFILKVNPQKRMVFDPTASVDMQGQTAPYVQNAYVRVQSLLRKAADLEQDEPSPYREVEESERHLLQLLTIYPEVIIKAANDLDPSGVANFCYDLAKSFHRFYHDVKILSADTSGARKFRLSLSRAVAQVLEHAMNLLGIEMPQRM